MVRCNKGRYVSIIALQHYVSFRICIKYILYVTNSFRYLILLIFLLISKLLIFNNIIVPLARLYLGYKLARVMTICSEGDVITPEHAYVDILNTAVIWLSYPGCTRVSRKS